VFFGEARKINGEQKENLCELKKEYIPTQKEYCVIYAGKNGEEKKNNIQHKE
jgi:hypothetical protein